MESQSQDVSSGSGLEICDTEFDNLFRQDNSYRLIGSPALMVTDIVPLPPPAGNIEEPFGANA